MTNAQNNINAFASDKFRIGISNLPTILDSVHNLNFLLENFTKGISIPSIKMEYVQSHYMGSVINHPVNADNQELQSFTWQIKLDESCLNYYHLWSYVQQIKFGQINSDGPLRKYDIHSFDIHFLDNQRITQKILSFENCLIEEVGGLELLAGNSEEVYFTVTMRYELAVLNDPPS